MKIWMHLFMATLFFSISAHARLGMTRSECDKKYGKPFYTENNDYADYMSGVFRIGISFTENTKKAFHVKYYELENRSDVELYLQRLSEYYNTKKNWRPLYNIWKATRLSSDSLVEAKAWPLVVRAEKLLDAVPQRQFSDSVTYDTIRVKAIRDAVLPGVSWGPFKPCSYDGIESDCYTHSSNFGFWNSSDNRYYVRFQKYLIEIHDQTIVDSSASASEHLGGL